MARKSRKFPQPNQETKAVVYDTWIYARISNETDKAEDSIENQIAISEDYISGKDDLTLCGVYTDLGFSGTNFERPDYEKMLADIQGGKVQCVIVKDLSRLGRTYIEVGELLFDTFPAYGVRFISINDHYDSFDENAGRQKLLILFKNLVNHMYSKDLSKKIRSSFVTKQQKGELLGSMPPYGYVFTSNRNGKHLEVEPESAKIVKQIFDLRLQGLSTIKIAEYLNANAVPAPRYHYYQLGLLTNKKYSVNTVWQNGFIGALLVNEVYTGCQIQGKYVRHGKKHSAKPKNEWIIHRNTHMAIIGEVQFEAVQKLMVETGNKYRKHGNKLDDNIFVGKVFCSRCGKAAKRKYHQMKNGTKYSYHCRACDAELKREMSLGTIKPIPMEHMEAAVCKTLQGQMDSCMEIDSLLDKISRSSSITHKRYSLTQERDKFIKAGKRAEELLSAAYAHHLDGLLDRNEFEFARAKFENDKQSALLSLARVESELSEYELEEVRENDCLANFRVFKDFNSLDKAIIDALVYRIDITPFSNHIAVTLNFKNSFEKLDKLVKESGVMINES